MPESSRCVARTDKLCRKLGMYRSGKFRSASSEFSAYRVEFGRSGMVARKILSSLTGSVRSSAHAFMVAFSETKGSKSYKVGGSTCPSLATAQPRGQNGTRPPPLPLSISCGLHTTSSSEEGVFLSPKFRLAPPDHFNFTRAIVHQRHSFLSYQDHSIHYVWSI